MLPDSFVLKYFVHFCNMRYHILRSVLNYSSVIKRSILIYNLRPHKFHLKFRMELFKKKMCTIRRRKKKYKLISQHENAQISEIVKNFVC